mmetsp:Transcript_97993/g.277149  ORF Transcript_97993/g.277149 Transcript_97993/m.277149 type:complete len:307 (-) Transcript_97993:156-1076(-)
MGCGASAKEKRYEETNPPKAEGADAKGVSRTEVATTKAETAVCSKGPARQETRGSTMAFPPSEKDEGEVESSRPVEMAREEGEVVSVEAFDPLTAALKAWAGREEPLGLESAMAKEEDGIVTLFLLECYTHFTHKYEVKEESGSGEHMYSVKMLERGVEQPNEGDDLLPADGTWVMLWGEQQAPPVAACAGSTVSVDATDPLAAALKAWAGPQGPVEYRSACGREVEDGTVLLMVEDCFNHYTHKFGVRAESTEPNEHDEHTYIVTMLKRGEGEVNENGAQYALDEDWVTLWPVEPPELDLVEGEA